MLAVIGIEVIHVTVFKRYTLIKKWNAMLGHWESVIVSNSFFLLKKISFTQISLYLTKELVHTVK